MIVPKSELFNFIISIMYGLLYGSIYSFIITNRKFIKHTKLTEYIENIIFSVCIGITLFHIINRYNCGMYRGYIIIGLMCGFIVSAALCLNMLIEVYKNISIKYSNLISKYKSKAKISIYKNKKYVRLKKKGVSNMESKRDKRKNKRQRRNARIAMFKYLVCLAILMMYGSSMLNMYDANKKYEKDLVKAEEELEKKKKELNVKKQQVNYYQSDENVMRIAAKEAGLVRPTDVVIITNCE